LSILKARMAKIRMQCVLAAKTVEPLLERDRCGWGRRTFTKDAAKGGGRDGEAPCSPTTFTRVMNIVVSNRSRAIRAEERVCCGAQCATFR